MIIGDFYLICFIVGCLLSILSFAFGAVNIHFHWPIHGHFGGGHAHVHAGHVTHGSPNDIAYFNFGTITAFIAWFGGVGYLLTRYTSLYALTAFALSAVAGFTGSALVFLFLSKVLLRHEKWLDQADFEMVGVLGHIASSIREGGTGELIYAQEGTRRVCGARSEQGTAIDKGAEVVVTRYERGIAYVRRWEELAESVEVQASTNL